MFDYYLSKLNNKNANLIVVEGSCHHSLTFNVIPNKYLEIYVDTKHKHDSTYNTRRATERHFSFLVRFYHILLTKTTAALNEAALSYHNVRGLYFVAVVFVRSIVLDKMF